MHNPVLLSKVIEYLDLKPGDKIIDATFGFGGHSKKISEKINGGKILGIERDPEVIEQNKDIPDNVNLIHGHFGSLKSLAKDNGFDNADGILMDIGFSSYHIDESNRGFSFQKDEPLDMRYDPTSNDLTAEYILNNYSEREISEILWEYGEERFSRPIAKKIVETRKGNPIKTTFQLVEIIDEVVPFRKRGRISPATKTFQALRITVNQELEMLERGLKDAEEVLKPGGRLVVISFHSLEDRIVKNFFKKETFEILTKKPITPDEEEILKNPRSRSAKLRVVIKK